MVTKDDIKMKNSANSILKAANKMYRCNLQIKSESMSKTILNRQAHPFLQIFSVFFWQI